MGVYRCPSSCYILPPPDSLPPIPSSSKAVVGRRLSRLTVTSSGSSSSTPIPEPPKPRKSRKDDGRRIRSGMDLNKKQDIELAKKRRALLRRRDTYYVYVGNVEPSVSEVDLRKAFEKCGPILRVQKRCSQGIAVNLDRQPSAQIPSNRQYATIEFKNPPSIPKALKLDGTPLHGAPLIVCSRAQDLPEGQSRPRLQKWQPSKGSFPLLSYFQHKPRPLVRQVTEPVLEGGCTLEERSSDDLYPPRNPHKNFLFGISFPKTLT